MAFHSGAGVCVTADDYFESNACERRMGATIAAVVASTRAHRNAHRPSKNIALPRGVLNQATAIRC